MQLYSVGMICGFTIGIQYELIDSQDYLIISLGIVEIVLIR
jgi:hypothetical protein